MHGPLLLSVACCVPGRKQVQLFKCLIGQSHFTVPVLGSQVKASRAQKAMVFLSSPCWGTGE